MKFSLKFSPKFSSQKNFDKLLLKLLKLFTLIKLSSTSRSFLFKYFFWKQISRLDSDTRHTNLLHVLAARTRRTYSPHVLVARTRTSHQDFGSLAAKPLSYRREVRKRRHEKHPVAKYGCIWFAARSVN